MDGKIANMGGDMEPFNMIIYLKLLKYGIRYMVFKKTCEGVYVFIDQENEFHAELNQKTNKTSKI